MGCSNSREDNISPKLSSNCTELMNKNLELLTLIEYNFLNTDNVASALLIMNIKKRTEDYYAVVTKFRNYWISRSRNFYLATSRYEYIKKCELEQIKEKEQLQECKSLLESIMQIFQSDWNKNQNLEKLKIEFEKNPDFMQSLTAFYYNFYLEGKKEIKSHIQKLRLEISSKNMKIIKSIKSVTVNFYKHPGNRVYYTDDIMFNDKGYLELDDIRYSTSQK